MNGVFYPRSKIFDPRYRINAVVKNCFLLYPILGGSYVFTL